GAAETAYRSALTEYPQNARISYGLAKALQCGAQADLERAAELYSQSIYQFVRATALDPSLELGDYAAKAYAAYHGSEEGFEHLREQARSGPFPPEAFQIDPAAKISERSRAIEVENSPQTALWKKLREHLTAEDAFQYFNQQLKNSELAGEKGVRA